MESRPVAAAHAVGEKPRLTDRKRAAIVRAAAAEFQASGFDGTSMDQIAARARVSKRTVYNHFPSKEDLFREIIAQLTARLEHTDHFSFDGELPLEEQLTTIGAVVIDAISGEDFISLTRVVLSRFLQRPDLAEKAIGSGQKPFRAGLTAWIEDARGAGRLDLDDADLAARQFVALLNSAAFWPQLLAGQPPLSAEARDNVLRATVSMFLDHYAK
ncbi:MAG: TetR/AcrR family transcriptional regulator [Acidobacteriota bacterium]|jgi:TetR/AcrR family transcriptional regulator of autoinduction and epiphytic fitness